MARQKVARLLRALAVLAPAIAVLGASPTKQAGPARPLEQKLDAIFAGWNANTPGCVVGVSSGGRIVLEKAYGMADLEHDVPNTPASVFEIASVSKQFTAAAVLLLARDGKLSLDDPVRRYIPTLPDYRRPLLIRHLLTHTSGLREWRTLEAIAGWPHRSREYTDQTMLDIVSRQRALNFEPGTHFCYTNANYNLAAVIVARVSGQSLAEFCQARIFQPLGMTRTSWGDDSRRVIKGRAIGYSEGADGYRRNTPGAGPIGHAGLQTTVGDLLRWNENFFTPKVGDEEFVRVEQEAGRFNDGRQHHYALGLIVGARYKGLREVLHGGAGAGYRASLTRFPDQHLSVAVLCNATSARPGRDGSAVADLYLADAINAAMPATKTTTDHAIAVTDRMKSRVGMYRSTMTGAPLTIVYDQTQFGVEGGAQLVPRTEATFQSPMAAQTFEFDHAGRLLVTDRNGTSETYERADLARPTAAELQALVGSYESDEAEVTIQLAVENGQLKMRRPDARFTLRPLYKDAFSVPELVNDVAGAPGHAMILFRRDPHGRVTAFSVVAADYEASVWDLRFERRRGSRTR